MSSVPAGNAPHVVFSEHAFVRRLTALVPRPYHHSVRYFGVLASASPLRSRVVPVPTPPLELHLHHAAGAGVEMTSPASAKGRTEWAILLRRVYNVDALACPRPECGGRLRPIAVITRPDVVRTILDHTGLNDEPPPPRVRGPPEPVLFAD